MDYLIGVDVGTTATKAVLYDDQARVQASFKAGYSLYRDATGMAEQDPAAIVAAVKQVIGQAAAKIDFSAAKLLAVSFSSANQSVILLDQDHRPLTRALTWADTRARGVAEALKQEPAAVNLFERTGTPLHPMSPLTKLIWLRQNQPALVAKAAYVADIKSYLFWELFNTFRVDISIASCTGMFNLFTNDWDEEALKLTGISRDQLPEVVAGTSQAQGLLPAAAAEMGIPETTPFVYGAFDGALSNLGVGATRQDTVAITIGTSAAVRVATDHPVIDPKRRLFCYAIDEGSYVVGGPINNGGAVFQWAVEHLVDARAARQEGVAAFTLANQVIATTPAGAHGLLFHPFLGGERAPLWDANARGSFFGLTPLHTRADMLRAVMEGICLNIATVFGAVEELVGRPQQVTATGGFAQSAVWKQMLADVLAVPVRVPETFESGCLGAITMAMKSLGLIASVDAVQQFIGATDDYQPQAAQDTYTMIKPLFEQVEREVSPSYKAVADLQAKLTTEEK